MKWKQHIKIWDAAKAVVRKFIALKRCLGLLERKKGLISISSIFHLKKLEKVEQIKPKVSRERK